MIKEKTRDIVKAIVFGIIGLSLILQGWLKIQANEIFYYNHYHLRVDVYTLFVAGFVILIGHIVACFWKPGKRKRKRRGKRARGWPRGNYFKRARA